MEHPERDVSPVPIAARSPERTDPATAYLASFSPNGRLAMAKRLRVVAALLDVPTDALVWEGLRFAHVAALRQRLVERGAAPATVNLTLAALRGVARYARNMGLLPAAEYEHIRDVRPARACTADRSPAGARDAAILAVLYTGGVRRAELAGLDLADWSAEPPTLRVRGKGDKERLVPLAGGAAAATRAWLRARGDRPGGLFLPINKGGRLCGDHISDHAVYAVLRKRLLEAGVARLSPHDLRRTFVGDLLDAGIDLATVQRLAGHASPTTTARYDRRGEATKRRAIEALHFPYGGEE